MNKKRLFNILVTDINHHVRDLLQRELELEGYTVHSVKSAVAAREFIFGSAVLDLIILDPELFYPFHHSFVASIRQHRGFSIHIIIHTYEDSLRLMAGGTGFRLVEKNARSIVSLKSLIYDCFLTRGRNKGDNTLVNALDSKDRCR